MINAKRLLLTGLVLVFSTNCGETDAPEQAKEASSNGGSGETEVGTGGNSAQAGTGGLASGGTDSGGGPNAEAGSLGTPEVLAEDFVFLARLAVDQSHVYVADRPQFLPDEAPEKADRMDGIYAVPIAGGEPTLITEMESPTTVAVVKDELWVSGQELPAILALDKRSGAELRRIALPGNPVAMDQSASQVYVATTPATISGLPIGNGSGRTMLLPSSVMEFFPFWMDSVDNELVVSFYDLGEQTELVYFADTSAEAPAVSMLSRSGLFVGVLIVEDALLVADNVQGTVERVPKDGSAPSVLVPLADAWALGMDTTHIYATARPDIDDCSGGVGRIVRFKHDGTDLEVLADGLDCPSEMKVTTEAIYWVDSGVVGRDANEQVFALPGSRVMRIQKH